MNEMGKLVPRGIGRGGGFRGCIVINCLKLDGVTISIHGWVALSFLF